MTHTGRCFRGAVELKVDGNPFAATIPSLAFRPEVHVNHAETVLPMKGGLPKLKDFAAELGGSSQARPE